jgi:adenine-specific DNA-methyltransferase
MFAKSINSFHIGRLPRTKEANARYQNPDNDPRGVWKPSDMSVKTYTPENDYEIKTPTGKIVQPPTGRCWRLSKKIFFDRLQDNRIWFGSDGNSVPQIKRFLAELKYDGMAPQSIMFYKDVGHSQEGSQEVTALLESGAFDGPKPVRLLERLLTLANLEKESIVLDFFSGSASTAHAVMKKNAENHGKYKFIMVQLPETTSENGTAARDGYANICEIGKERIRRAGEKIKADNSLTAQDIDTGFRVLKLDDSTMKDVYYAAGDYDQEQLELFTSNIKVDRTDMDLLYSCLLDWGLPLSLSHIHEEIDGVTVHTYNYGDLIACFADTVSKAVVKEIAKRQPLRVVFRDSSFADSPSKINVGEIFKLLAPNTSVKVI